VHDLPPHVHDEVSVQHRTQRRGQVGRAQTRCAQTPAAQLVGEVAELQTRRAVTRHYLWIRRSSAPASAGSVTYVISSETVDSKARLRKTPGGLSASASENAKPLTIQSAFGFVT
jgi:hypothetical protein